MVFSYKLFFTCCGKIKHFASIPKLATCQKPVFLTYMINLFLLPQYIYPSCLGNRTITAIFGGPEIWNNIKYSSIKKALANAISNKMIHRIQIHPIIHSHKTHLSIWPILILSAHLRVGLPSSVYHDSPPNPACTPEKK